jgi:hypothetical protein
MEIPRHWRLKAQRYRLKVQSARAAAPQLPACPVCPYCAARPAVIAGWGPPVWPRPASSLDIKSPILYGITERIPG